MNAAFLMMAWTAGADAAPPPPPPAAHHPAPVVASGVGCSGPGCGGVVYGGCDTCCDSGWGKGGLFSRFRSGGGLFSRWGKKGGDCCAPACDACAAPGCALPADGHAVPHAAPPPAVKDAPKEMPKGTPPPPVTGKSSASIITIPAPPAVTPVSGPALRGTTNPY